MHNTTSANNHIIPKLRPFQNNRVHPYKTIVSNFYRCSMGILLIQALMPILQLYGMEIIVYNFTVGSNSCIIPYFDTLVGIDGTTTYTAVFANLYLTTIPDNNNTPLV